MQRGICWRERGWWKWGSTGVWLRPRRRLKDQAWEPVEKRDSEMPRHPQQPPWGGEPGLLPVLLNMTQAFVSPSQIPREHT